MIIMKPEKKKKYTRYSVFFVIMAFIFTAIIAKLTYMQIYKHDDYQEKADDAATKFIGEKAPRGIIYDQNGNILATNRQTYAMTYTTTEESSKNFFKTVDSVVKILSENGSGLEDSLILKLDENEEPYFEFTNSTDSGKQSEEIRFKRDRGLNEDIESNLFKDTNDLTDSQINQVNSELMKITPKETFYSLVKLYSLIDLVDPDPDSDKAKEYKEMTGEELTNILLKDYSMSTLRNYILVKDALKMQSFKGYKSITLASNINKDLAFIIMQKLNDLPGIDVSLEPTREYPYKSLASSVLGYISSISSENESKYELKGYDASTDLIGVAGIESAFEDQLKGVKGGTTVKVNSKGRVTQNLFQLESYPGNSVHLTIDKNIQSVAERSLEDALEELRTTGGYPGATRGAAIAVEVDTGRILASVSYPQYDPSDFATGKVSDEKTKEYFSPDYDTFGNNLINSLGLNKTIDELFPMEDGVRTDPKDLYPKPFYNYATQGLIPPGSTFKPLSAIAGLESGVVTPSETINDVGEYRLHQDVFGKGFHPSSIEFKQYGVGMGPVDVVEALEKSCNYYFYDVAYRLYEQGGLNIEALDSLAQYAWKFGLGYDPDGTAKRSTGIELPENYGQVYNFKSNKENRILFSKFKIRDILESGVYESFEFIPLDYNNNEDDDEKLKNAKKNLKEKITNTLNNIGTEDEIKSSMEAQKELKKLILDDIKDIMNLSDKYADNVKAYEESGKGTFNIDKQAGIVADAITKYVISDEGTQIKSPAQEVYAAIGQGMNLFTPMQLAQYVSTIANGGTRYKLHYVDEITDPDGNVIEKYDPEVVENINLQESTLKAVVEGMKRVNSSEDGTAKAAFANFPIETAGKTGTADFSEDQKDYGREPYATYIGFAPADSPKIAVVLAAYDGGHGGTIANVAKSIYEQYFKDELLAQNPNYESQSETFKKYVLTVPGDIK